MPSKWGNSADTINVSLAKLAQRTGSNVNSSPLYRTPAFPAGVGPDYVNAAAILDCALNPQQMLDLCNIVEVDAGRVRTKRWDSRTLDVDLIACESHILPDEQTFLHWHDLPLSAQKVETPKDLILPHPRLQDRAFVLVPLHDIAPDWCHPVLGRTTRQLMMDLSEADRAAIKRLG